MPKLANPYTYLFVSYCRSRGMPLQRDIHSCMDTKPTKPLPVPHPNFWQPYGLTHRVKTRVPPGGVDCALETFISFPTKYLMRSKNMFLGQLYLFQHAEWFIDMLKGRYTEAYQNKNIRKPISNIGVSNISEVNIKMQNCFNTMSKRNLFKN